jgi:hypothetical protein
MIAFSDVQALIAKYMVGNGGPNSESPIRYSKLE